MKKILLILFIIINIFSYGEVNEKKKQEGKIERTKEESKKSFEKLGMEKFYKNLNISEELDYKVFEVAMNGYLKIDYKNKDEIIIVDLSKDSSEERFFFIDLKEGRVKYKTFVTHGKNSGAEKAVSFSNQPNSFKSSVGFYLTRSHYNGKYGYSVRLKGLEEGFNSNAIARGIVIHGAKEAEQKYIDSYGFLGRTEGCPAIPYGISRKVMEDINMNTVLFIYGNDENYFEKSIYL